VRYGKRKREGELGGEIEILVLSESLAKPETLKTFSTFCHLGEGR